MLSVTLDELRTLAAVARLGTLSAAAKELSLSSSAVSRRLDALELQLGVRLLNRSTRAVSLTADGDAYLQQILPALADISAAGNRLRDQITGPQGALRVSLPVNYGRLHIAPHLADFLGRCPAVSLDASFEDRYVDVIGEGFDLAVRIGQLEDSRLVAKRIADDQRVIVASPAYLATHGTPQHPRDLLDHQCLHFTSFRGPEHWVFQRDGGRVSVPVKGRLKSNYGLPLTIAAERGLGLVHTSRSIIRDALITGTLIPVLDAWRLPDIGVYAVFPERRHTPSKLHAFIDFLTSVLE